MTTADGAVIGMTQIFGSAPRNRAFNVVLMGDGFTNAQQNDFNTACNSFVTAFRGTPPFDDLSPAINVFRINVRSTDRQKRYAANVCFFSDDSAKTMTPVTDVMAMMAISMRSAACESSMSSNAAKPIPSQPKVRIRSDSRRGSAMPGVAVPNCSS